MKYDFKRVKAHCPVCHSVDGNLLYSINSYQAAQHFILKEVDRQRFLRLRLHIEDIWGADSCQVINCSACNYCYAYPYVAGDSEFYALAYDRSGYPMRKWEYQVTREKIQDISNGQINNLRLLEIGAGNGAFVKMIAPDLLPKSNVLCTEYSDYGISSVREYGIECIPGDIGQISDKNLENRFDIVCMFQVLEHLDELDGLFDKINKITSNNAHIFIAVPNPEMIKFNELNDLLLDMPPNHIGRWNKRSFEIICRRYGWVLADYKEEINNLLTTIITFTKYRFHRKSQMHNSIANIIQRGDKRSGCFLKIIAAFFYTLYSLPACIILLNKKIGNSIWVHIKI